MPTLNWIGKEKVVTHHQNVPLRVLDRKYTFGDMPDSGNMIIHGDNLEALKALLPEYENRIKCIYIDPPYNTGNEKWVYNDNVNDPHIRKWLGLVVGPESEDLTRHDKWLCMMYPRLVLLQRLLAEDGAIFISIDDNEQANLKLICDEIFGSQNFVAQLIIQSNSAKNNANYISTTHDYILIYSKSINHLPKGWRVKKSYIDEFKKRVKYLYSMGLPHEEIHQELLALIKYPRFFEFDHYTYADKNGAFRASDLTAPGSTNFFDIIHPVTHKKCKEGIRGWGHSEEEMAKLIDDDRILFGNDEETVPQLKNYLFESETSIPRSVLFFDTQNSTKFIKSQGFDFQFPKPVDLITYIINLVTDKNSIILDSFAGSGTTAHAVLNLNKRDGGNRKFILCEMMDYAENITAERVRRVIRGYGKGKNAVEGTGGNFDFYELGETVFDPATGLLNNNVDTEQIRKYVWYAETHMPYTKPAEGAHPYLLGSWQQSNYYFYSVEGEETCLGPSFLNTLTERDRAEMYIIYADRCVLTEEEMMEKNIRFKKIPTDIKRV